MKLHLLKNRCASGYVSFGSYWEKSEAKNNLFMLTDAEGSELPMQTAAAAYWPDGSIKWARHTANSNVMGELVSVLYAAPAAPARAILIREDTACWHVDAGRITLRICKPGSDRLAEGICLDHILRVECIVPVFHLERRNETADVQDIRISRCHTIVEKVDIEEAGPLLMVVRFDGYYEAREELMPFRIRMYVGLDADDLRFEHTFFFNGVEKRDFLKGMGIRYFTPLTGRSYNRHVKFLTDYGVFHEPASLIESKYPRSDPALKIAQLAGENLDYPLDSESGKQIAAIAPEVPAWNQYCLTQLTAGSYALTKRTKPGCCTLQIESGRRAPGCMAVSGENGGIMLASRDFWQRFPSGLEVENLSEEGTCCTAWFYSPNASAFNFRHYDTRSYALTNYEGFPEFGSTADGISTTSHCRLLLVNSYPTDEAMQTFGTSTQKPAVYVATPEEYHAKRVFGYWSLPECASSAVGPVERALESMMDQAITFYQEQLEQRGWYGLFNYGDFMHSYDAQRHCWKYDIGGCAWQNTELVPTYWLWTYFLRTGREDVFSLAEAMSRHCSETDIYHFGPRKGIGSRHNVVHWGCPCKEPRISMAGHHRPLFYLTGDRRMGDIFDDVKDADLSLRNLYNYYVNTSNGYQLTARTGPDWAAFVSNWMTAYERTLDNTYLEKIQAGITSISQTPMRLGSGATFIFEPTHGIMDYMGESPANLHLTVCMGGPQVWMEAADAIDSELLRDMLDEYGKLYLMTPEERIQAYGELAKEKPFGMSYVACAMTAWSAARRQDDDLAQRTWKTLLEACPLHHSMHGFEANSYACTQDGVLLKELAWISTNYTAQWCLNTMIALEFIRSKLPTEQEAIEFIQTNTVIAM